jgi:hypothetical protein
MAPCPCCGELLPESAVQNELCPSCANAMDGLVEPGQSVEHTPVPIQRPTGVTILAVLQFICMVFFLIAALAEVTDWFFDRASQEALGITGMLLFSAFLFFLFGRALWELKEWMRVLGILLSTVALVSGGPPGDWWVRGLNALVIFYLMSSKVKATFRAAGAQPEPIIMDRWLGRRRSDCN